MSQHARPGTALADDWHDEPLPPNLALGERTWLYSSFAFIHHQSRRDPSVRIGHDSGIYHATVFDLGPNAEVVIGDYCTLAGPIISTRGRIVIGDYALISFGVVIADSFAAGPPGSRDHLEGGRPAASREGVVIGENVWIGARAILLDGARVGSGAVVGAGAVVDFPVPADVIVAGNPARVTRSVSSRQVTW